MFDRRSAKLITGALLAAVCVLAPWSRALAGQVIVHPKFGGEIIGYNIDRDGTEGSLAEAFAESGGKSLVALEAFDQKTGAITKVIAKEDHTLDDYAVQGLDAHHLGLVLFQHVVKSGIENHYLTINPLDGNRFTGHWTPPIKSGYSLGPLSVVQGNWEVATYEFNPNLFNTFVFSSNVAKNTFSARISLQSLINATGLFFTPLIALDNKTNEAVLADSHGCPEQVCVESIAKVNLTTGKIKEFTNNLGVGTVDGLAVDSATGIACTTTAIDQGVEFYDLNKETGFEVQIPNSGNSLQAGLDVQFDPIHRWFLVPQWTSGSVNNPTPKVYVYDEDGNVKQTIGGLLRIALPSLLKINPHTRTGFLDVIVEPQHEFLELQSFSY